jgi:PEGA domain-containing protein
MRWFFALALAACAAPAAAPAPPVPTGELVVRCPVADATLWIDERPVGEVGRVPGVRLAAGAHRVELRHDRYHTRYAEVTVTAGARAELDLTLAEAFP